ncbi:unnamed protein product [Phytophthora fragariaefolia]|uniref:Unnamed protein product n=1 Tax=Phytophthora fragariaefolia TaxID=1490495 RepID=A0A9W7D8G3_9STRA|nr:unnamed protein product [Phytophthora fragariaefolia]
MARYKKGHNQSSKRKHQKASDVKVSSTSTPAPPPVTAIDTSLFFSPAEAESFAKLQVDLLRQVKTAKRVLGKFRKETFWIKDESIEVQVDRQLNLASPYFTDHSPKSPSVLPLMIMTRSRAVKTESPSPQQRQGPQTAQTKAATPQDAHHEVPPAGTANVAPDAMSMQQLMIWLTQQQQMYQTQMQTQFQMQMQQANNHFEHLLASQGERRKKDPPMYEGKFGEDLELWTFAMEGYYANKRGLMEADTSDFVTMISCSLGANNTSKPPERKLSPKSGPKEDWRKSATCHNCGQVGHIKPQCKSTKESNHHVGGSFYAILEVKALAYNQENTCERCQRNKARQTKPPGLLQPLEIPGGRWVDVSMDFMIVLPSTETGKDAIMVFVDRLTKRAKFIATNTNAIAEETAALFMVNYVKDHGVPKSIISDRDSKFTSKFWQEVIKTLETTHNLSSAFRPQTDGQTERTNRRVHSSSGMSPFEADLGRVPYMPDDVARDPEFEQLHKSAQEFLLKQDAILKMAQDAMSEAQTRMKSYYDKNRLAQDFKPGDMVLLDGRNLDIRHKGFAQSKKLAPRFIGPYPVVKQIHRDSYELKLSKGLKLHSVSLCAKSLVIVTRRRNSNTGFGGLVNHAKKQRGNQ